MPTRFARLALPGFLAALDTWRTLPDDAGRAQLEAALASLIERTGFAGAGLSLEAPPLAPVTIRVGSLAGNGADGDGTAAAADGLNELPLVTGPAAVPVGHVRMDGGDDSSVSAPDLAIAIAMAIELVRDRERARRAEGHLEALDEAVRGVARVLDIDLVPQQLVDRVRILVQADYAALGTIDDRGEIVLFITSGIGMRERERIGHPPRGRGLLGLIIREDRPLRIDDIAADERRYGFPPNHPAMHAFLGVPVIAGGRTAGNLYLTRGAGGHPFTAGDQALVERFALHAGIAMENARLHDRVQRLTIVEERERIGRDLHDQIIQRLYGISLLLDDVPEMVSTDPPAAGVRIEEAIDSLTAAIQEIRTFVFGLRPVELGERGLVGALEQMAGEVNRSVGLEVSFRIEPGIAPPMEALAELLSVAREALANVARHAEASAAEIELSDDGRAFRLEVIDDGRGFDTATAPRPGHHGLANMRERAERMGGVLEIASREGRGTRIILSLPHRRDGAADQPMTDQDR